MSSYLSIYLERKPKEGEEKGERLLLCSIPRASALYEQFYNNRPGIPNENNFYKVDSADLFTVSNELENQISSEEIYIDEKKLNLSLIVNKEAILDVLDDLKNNKKYLEQLKTDCAMIIGIANVLSDVGKEWSDFNGIYWRIE